MPREPRQLSDQENLAVRDVLESDWAYSVEDRGYETPCFVWSGWTDRAGYGHARGTVERRAHREAYRRVHGEIPEGWHVHHRCEVTSCVNPDHLEAKSHSEHLRDHKRATMAKLTLDQVDEIRGRLATGELQLPLSREYGVTGRVIWQICNDVKWRDDPYAPRQPIVHERYCPECGVQVTGRHDKKFCCKDHRRRFNGRHGWRRRNGSLALDDDGHDA